jgi:HSP20 family protein
MKLSTYRNRDLMSDVSFPSWVDAFLRGTELPETSSNFFRPHVEIQETDTAYSVSAELPGVKKEDIKIDLKNSELLISGSKEVKKESKDGKVHLSEFSYGKFSRSFNLPELVDKSKIAADFTDGLLSIHLPKVKEAKPQTIKIK